MANLLPASANTIFPRVHTPYCYYDLLLND